MTVEIKKQEKETFASLLRRFSRKVKESGVLNKVRSLQFKTRPESKKTKKETALRKIARIKRMEYLKKLGKIK